MADITHPGLRHGLLRHVVESLGGQHRFTDGRDVAAPVGHRMAQVLALRHVGGLHRGIHVGEHPITRGFLLRRGRLGLAAVAGEHGREDLADGRLQLCRIYLHYCSPIVFQSCSAQVAMSTSCSAVPPEIPMAPASSPST